MLKHLCKIQNRYVQKIVKSFLGYASLRIKYRHFTNTGQKYKSKEELRLRGHEKYYDDLSTCWVNFASILPSILLMTIVIFEKYIIKNFYWTDNVNTQYANTHLTEICYDTFVKNLIF